MKKKQDTIIDLPVEPVEEKEETVCLSLVEATDVSEAPKKTKLKDSIKSLFVTEDEQEEKTKKRRKKSTFFQKHIYLFVGSTIFICNVLWPETWKETFTVEDKEYTLSPSQEHITAILEPLARIADRHTNIADVNPDVTDILSSITAMVAYGFEIRSLLMLKRYYEKEQEERMKKVQFENSLRSFK